MRMRRLTRLVASALLCAAGLLAQDAGMVLATSVQYRTQRNILPLSEEQKKEADRLSSEAAQLGRSGKFGDALRLYFQAFAVMRNLPWTPGDEFAASLRAKADRQVAPPGGRLKVTLLPLYTSERTALVKLRASVWLAPAPAQRILDGIEVDAAKLPAEITVTLPDDAAGNRTLEVRLAPMQAPTGGIRAAANKSVPLQIVALGDDLEKLRANPRALWAVDLYRRASAGELNPHSVDLRAEFAKAKEMLDHPDSVQRGILRRVYRSEVDQSLQPYRLFVPPGYDPAKPMPLVVALHGMGGDENTFFTRHEARFTGEATRLGFLVVCPKGRGPASMYRGDAERDVIDAIADVRASYNVDASRIYLMGHSMGGYGAWSVAMNHPELFAALGPIAGGGNPTGAAKIAKIPWYVVHGDADPTVPVQASRAMVEAARQAGVTVEYVEVKGGNHEDVVAPSIAPMFDFFARQHR